MLVARAERLARERSQFAAAAAHELRTPLAGLQLYGDMLADGLGDPAKLRDYARRMSEEAARLGRVVSNVLGFSQLERGNLSVDTRVASLGDALRELADARARPRSRRRGARARRRAPALSGALRSRRPRADRRATCSTTPRSTAAAPPIGRSTLAARAAGAVVEVVVTDRGPGIAARARPRLFQPFARGVTERRPGRPGPGPRAVAIARARDGRRARPTARHPAVAPCFVLTLPRG